MIGQAQRAQIERNERRLAADRAAAERQEERLRVQAFTCLALPTLLESVGLGRRHAPELRRNGWTDVDSLRKATIHDLVACGLHGYEARMLMQAVKAITDPRRMLNGGKFTKKKVETLVDRSVKASADVDDENTIRVTSMTGLVTAATGGGPAAVSRRDAEKAMIAGTSEGLVRLQDSLAGRADKARQRLLAAERRSLKRPQSVEAAAAAAAEPVRARTPASAREVVESVGESLGWPAAVGAVVRSAAHRLAWRWCRAHLPDRCYREMWGNGVIRAGRWPASAIRSGDWAPDATAAYNAWLGDQPSSVNLGCEKVPHDIAVAEQAERTVSGLARLVQRKGGSDCALASFALEQAHLVEAHSLTEPEPEPAWASQSLSGRLAPDGASSARKTQARQVAGLLTLAFVQREGRMRRVLHGWVRRSTAMRAASRKLRTRLVRMDRARMQRSFDWWTEIWEAGEKGRHRRNLLANQQPGEPSAHELKERRARKWQQWERAHARKEEKAKERRAEEYRIARRERLLNDRRAQTADAKSARMNAIGRDKAKEEAAKAAWEARLQNLADTEATTRKLEAREVTKQRARVEIRKAEERATQAEEDRKQASMDRLLEDTVVWLRMVSTPQGKLRPHDPKQSPALVRQRELEKTKARLTRSRQSTRRQERWQRKKQMASLAREKSVLAEELERHERELQQRSRTSGREREEEWLRRQRHHHRSAVMRPASTA